MRDINELRAQVAPRPAPARTRNLARLARRVRMYMRNVEHHIIGQSINDQLIKFRRATKRGELRPTFASETLTHIVHILVQYRTHTYSLRRLANYIYALC